MRGACKRHAFTRGWWGWWGWLRDASGRIQSFGSFQFTGWFLRDQSGCFELLRANASEAWLVVSSVFSEAASLPSACCHCHPKVFSFSWDNVNVRQHRGDTKTADVAFGFPSHKRTHICLCRPSTFRAKGVSFRLNLSLMTCDPCVSLGFARLGIKEGKPSGSSCQHRPLRGLTPMATAYIVS